MTGFALYLPGQRDPVFSAAKIHRGEDRKVCQWCGRTIRRGATYRLPFAGPDPRGGWPTFDQGDPHHNRCATERIESM